jgi:hypothetical protein
VLVSSIIAHKTLNLNDMTTEKVNHHGIEPEMGVNIDNSVEEPGSQSLEPSLESSVEVYSIYGSTEKWFIVGAVAVAGFFRYIAQSAYSLLQC